MSPMATMWFDFAAARAKAAGALSPSAPSDAATTSHDQAGAFRRRRSGALFIRLLRKDLTLSPTSVARGKRDQGRVIAPRPHLTSSIQAAFFNRLPDAA